MPRKGTQPSTARRREEGPPQSPDGTNSDAEPEPPPGRAGSPAPAAAGEYQPRLRQENALGTPVGPRPTRDGRVLLGVGERGCRIDA